MNQESIQQLVESIKTLNININDATTQKLVDTVVPVVKLYLYKEYVSMGMSFIFGLVLLYTIYKVITNIKKNDNH